MERLAELLERIPRRQGELLRALHVVQGELGWVPREAMALVAKRLKISEAQVYGPVTYYSEFRLTPPPRTLVTWCSGPACRMLGGDRIRRALEAELGCGMGENGPGDGYGLWFGQCNGSCERAPQIWVNGRVVGELDATAAVRLARRIKAGDDVAPAPENAVEIQPAHLQRTTPAPGAAS